MVPWATFLGAAFSVTGGELSLRGSSPGVTRGHCADCGTSITYANEARPGEIDVTLTSFVDPTILEPTAHIWVEDKLPWARIADGLPQFEKTAEGNPAGVSLCQVSSDADWSAYHDIRRRVLFENRGRFGVYDANRPDERLAGNFPLLLKSSSAALGVVRIDVRGEVAFFRRVAIDDPWQRRGFGRKLLKLAEAFARRRGATRVESAVAPDAVPFYAKCGYHHLDESVPNRASVRMGKAL
jgi:GNAT superfamily N-acetyltransferase